MKHHLLAPLYSLILKERPCDPDDLSVGNLVALRLLTGPYLGSSYGAWGIADVGHGQWNLSQKLDREIVDRDIFEPFYRHQHYGDYDRKPGKDEYVVNPPRQGVDIKSLVSGEDHVSATIRDGADVMMERLKTHDPAGWARLMTPTPEQLEKRQDISIAAIQGRGLFKYLQDILGDNPDWSLDAYGIKFHNPAYAAPNSLYFLAHNQDEVCGMMRLSTGRKWGYGVAFVSVAPGFRQQGLSRKLYQRAINQCREDGKALLRSDPDNHTPVNATLAYDQLLRASDIIHSASHGPLARPLQLIFEKGWAYEKIVEQLKSVCDDALPTTQQRMERYTGVFDYEAGQDLLARNQEVLEQMAAGPANKRNRKTGPKFR